MENVSQNLLLVEPLPIRGLNGFPGAMCGTAMILVPPATVTLRPSFLRRKCPQASRMVRVSAVLSILIVRVSAGPISRTIRRGNRDRMVSTFGCSKVAAGGHLSTPLMTAEQRDSRSRPRCSTPRRWEGAQFRGFRPGEWSSTPIVPRAIRPPGANPAGWPRRWPSIGKILNRGILFL